MNGGGITKKQHIENYYTLQAQGKLPSQNRAPKTTKATFPKAPTASRVALSKGIKQLSKNSVNSGRSLFNPKAQEQNRRAKRARPTK